jgi:hypothetical protein
MEKTNLSLILNRTPKFLTAYPLWLLIRRRCTPRRLILTSQLAGMAWRVVVRGSSLTICSFDVPDGGGLA